mgnify:CR=1 FL=1
MNPVNGNLIQTLGIQPGITAIIGSGGKSTLLRALGLELMQSGAHVLLATSTHMFPVAGIPWEGGSRRLSVPPWRAALSHLPGCTCEACAGITRGTICQTGTLDAATGKLSAPSEPFEALAARFDYVLVEADGSKRLPLKAHAAWEPVVPDASVDVLWVVGASGLGRPIAEAVHRPDLFCQRCGAVPGDTATPERVGTVLAREMRLSELKGARILLNQIDTLADPYRDAAARLERMAQQPVTPLCLDPR